MKMFRPWIVLAALALSLCSAVAQAQLGAAPNPLPARLADLEKSLALNPAQKAQFDKAAATSAKALAEAAQRRAMMKAAVDAEFAKARPDLTALALLHDNEMDGNRAAHYAARAEWLELYAMLDDSQAAVAKVRLQQHFRRLEALGGFVKSMH
jgi:hypothetical protein